MRARISIQSALWSLLFVLGTAFSVFAADGQVKIGQSSTTTFPVVIDKPGSYVVTSNLVVTTPGATGILILADDVTLDLNGFAVVGDKLGGNDSRGIEARLRKNITIRNGTVRNFFSDGVAIHYTAHSDPDNPGRNSIIEKLRVSENGFSGIVSSYGIIKDCVASNNGWFGIATNSGSIIDCEAYRNGFSEGLYVGGITASDSTIVNCTANFNKHLGIYAADSTIIGSTANQNQSIGIWSYIHGGQYRGSSSILNCTTNLNGELGIRLEGQSRVEGCNLRDNGFGGIYVRGQYNYVIKNVVSGNGADNINIDNPTQNYVPLIGENANVNW
jgi:parallel beta-helix repeat protein